MASNEVIQSRTTAEPRARILVVDDEPLEGYDRVYVSDPFGNRIELMEPKAGGQVPNA